MNIKKNNMKKIKFYSIISFIAGFIFSCDNNKSDLLTDNASEGGLITVNSALIPYVVGNGNTYAYEADFTVFQGNEKTTKIDVYKSFTNGLGVTSNVALLKTIDVPSNPQNQDIKFTVNYVELISGLTINGVSLPTNDGLLNIGDAWKLTYVTTTSEGKIHENTQTTKVSVGTRFAGTYKVIQGEYWRIGVPRPDVVWVGQTRVIESVNASTYKFIGYAGPFAGATNTHYFSISSSDLVTTPLTFSGTAQLLNGFGVINCIDTPSDIPNACGYAGPQNTVVRDNVNGKDKIYRTYGYFTTGSGPREIYEVLEKVVD